MMDEPIRTFSNLEISCAIKPSAREAAASLDRYMTRNKHLDHREHDEISLLFPPNHIRKFIPHNDDTLTTCSTSISTCHSVTSGSSASARGPLHHQESSLLNNCDIPQRRRSFGEESQVPAKKKVEFRLEEGGNVFCAYFEPEGPLSDEEKLAVWWQPMEFKLFRRYCKKAAQIARNSEYADHFTKVYDACSQKHITDVREHCHIARTHARGLEVVVFPTLVQARKLVIKGVVKTQEKLPATMDADQRAKVLSATSRCLTGRSRLLSRVFAVGDEEVAKDCYYSMKG